ncbi:hypothetical protein Hanom_Chr15g01399861 [Helianthus anomalus]
MLHLKRHVFPSHPLNFRFSVSFINSIIPLILMYPLRRLKEQSRGKESSESTFICRPLILQSQKFHSHQAVSYMLLFDSAISIYKKLLMLNDDESTPKDKGYGWGPKCGNYWINQVSMS